VDCDPQRGCETFLEGLQVDILFTQLYVSLLLYPSFIWVVGLWWVAIRGCATKKVENQFSKATVNPMV